MNENIKEILNKKSLWIDKDLYLLRQAGFCIYFNKTWGEVEEDCIIYNTVNCYLGEGSIYSTYVTKSKVSFYGAQKNMSEVIKGHLHINKLVKKNYEL